MKEAPPESPVTRRNFIEFASAALAGTGLAAKANAETAARKSQSTAFVGDYGAPSFHGKIALEEHFALAEIFEQNHTTRPKIYLLNSARRSSILAPTILDFVCS